MLGCRNGVDLESLIKSVVCLGRMFGCQVDFAFVHGHKNLFKDMTCGHQCFMMHPALAMFVGCIYRSGLMTSLSSRIGPN